VFNLNSVCDKIIIVTGYKANEVKENVNQLNINTKIEFVHNASFEKGMLTSLQAGLAKAIECDWILYHFVDQPGLPEDFYKEFVTQIDNKHNWIQPKSNNQKGHPLLINSNLFQLILDANLNSNLRLINNHPMVKKKFWECGYEEIFQDIDNEEDYSKLI
jgi:CTP:molybdopterin cytidylyltransferase MocA